MFSHAIAGSVVMAVFADRDPSRCAAGCGKVAGGGCGAERGRGVGEGVSADRGCWDRRAGVG